MFDASTYKLFLVFAVISMVSKCNRICRWQWIKKTKWSFPLSSSAQLIAISDDMPIISMLLCTK